MRKQTMCICENKGADQLRGNREADQHLCFRCTDSTIPLLKSEISVTVQAGLCQIWSETRIDCFVSSFCCVCDCIHCWQSFSLQFLDVHVIQYIFSSLPYMYVSMYLYQVCISFI